MAVGGKKHLWAGALLCLTLFGVLLAVRLDLAGRLRDAPVARALAPVRVLDGRDTWMNIFQNERKIGYAHRTFAPDSGGYRLREAVFMRINTMGLAQDLRLKTDARLNGDFTLKSVAFAIDSGRFKFELQGNVVQNRLELTTTSAGSARRVDLELSSKPYLSAGILDAVHASGLKPGDDFSFDIFDPATLGNLPVKAQVLSHDTLTIAGRSVPATKVALHFRGATQLAWIDPAGDVLQEEGLLGIRLVKATREEALFGAAVEASQDLTRVAAIPVDPPLKAPRQIRRLDLRLQGITYAGLELDGGRQTLQADALTVVRENLERLPTVTRRRPPRKVRPFLEATPFVQANHPRIRQLARSLVEKTDAPAVKARKLIDWVFDNIDKRPVLSLPDALATLSNRAGDCNEHAVLLAALARAVGIPAKIEAGLVYLDGRFYYHAWNLLYLGQWVTADALMGQLPADATHIRLSGGTQAEQLDLLSVIGNLRVTVIRQEND